MKKSSSYLFLLLIFLLPTQLGSYFFFPFSYINGIRIDYLAPALYLTDGVVFLLFITSYRKILPLSRLFGIFIVLITLVSFIFAIESSWIALYKAVKILEMILLFQIARQIKIKPKNILAVFIASLLLQLSLAILQLSNQGSLQHIFYFLGERYFTIGTPGIAKISIDGHEILRPYATFSHPNSMGGFAVLLYSFVLWKKEFRQYPLLKTALLIITSLLTIISFSKGAIMTYILITIAHAWVYTRRSCGFCFISKLFFIGILSMLFLNFHGDPESFEKRVRLTMNSFEIILKHPFFGVGIGNYLYAQSIFPTPYSYSFLQPVHNIFLLAIAELGIPLFIALLSFLVKKLRYYRHHSLFLICILVVVITGSLDHYWYTLQQNMLILAVISGLALQKDMVQ